MLRTFGLPGLINGTERTKLVKRDSDGKEVLDSKNQLQYEAKPRFIVTDKDESGEPLMTSIVRRDHEGKIIPGTTEIEVNMHMDPLTRKAIPGTGVKVLASVVKVPTSRSFPNPEYFEQIKDDKGNVTGHIGYDFHVNGVRKLAMPKNYRPQTEAPYLTQADANTLAAQRKTEQLEKQVSDANEKINQLIELVTNSLKPVDVAPVVKDTAPVEETKEVTDEEMLEAVKKTPGLFERIKNVLNLTENKTETTDEKSNNVANGGGADNPK